MKKRAPVAPAAISNAERIDYQVLSVTGTHDIHATVERYAHETPGGGIVQEFWGAFLPDGRMIAIPGDLPEDHAQIVYREACKKNRRVH